MKKYATIAMALFLLVAQLLAAIQVVAQAISVAEGWASNSVNVTAFRKNSLITHKDTQYISFYNQQQYVVIGKRQLGSAKWQLQQTPYKGNVADAHNGISLMVDGAGYLHLAWNHHNNPLHYCKSVAPGSLTLTPEIPMAGTLEQRVTYPEFYYMPNGNILFFYRNGESGQGNLVINHYNIENKKWQQVHSNLIDGENKRSAYWQACVDKKGTIHISWVWRETGNVASNHDMCYASSADGGLTWLTSTGIQYKLPITATNAEYIAHIPQGSDLINQTSMYVNEKGHPFIATYWREKNDSVPQYHVIFKINKEWQIQNLGFRKTAFTLNGMGTKRIPIARPQIISWNSKKRICTAIIFRDEERGNKISLAINNNMHKNKWKLKDVLETDVGLWEPTYDTLLWQQKNELNLFVQFVDQKDSEGKTQVEPQMIYVVKTFEL